MKLYIKTRRKNFSWSEAQILFRNTKYSIQELNFDRSVCMTSLYFSGTIYSEIVPLSWLPMPMPKFVKISCRIKKLFIQGHDIDRPVCMEATSICYSGPISANATNEQLLEEKRAREKSPVYTDWQTCINRISFLR